MAKKKDAVEAGGFTMRPFTSADIEYMRELTDIVVDYDYSDAAVAFALLIAGIAATEFDRETLACFIIEKALSKSRDVHHLMSDHMNKWDKEFRHATKKGGEQ